MKRILSFLLAAAAFLPGYARADEPVVSLAPATSLIGASTYLQASGVGNNQLLFNTTLFGVSAGALTINPNSITSSYLSNLLAGPGSCTNCNLSYDASGRLTVATSGSGGGGGGNFTGPAGAVSGDLISFNGTSGLIGQDSGILQSNVVTASGALTTNSILLGGGSRALGASIGPSAQGLAGWNTGGTPSVIALGSNLSMTGATLNAAGGGGGTPGGATQSIQINSSGAFAGIGPTAQTLAGWNTGGAAATITLGSNLSMTGSTLNATGGGSTAFSALTSGTNTTAAMLVGSGSSLGVTGTGAVTATNVPAALGTGSVCSTAGVLSAPVSCPISLVPQAGTSFALVAGNAGSLVVAQSGSIPTVTLAASSGALGAGFGVDLFTGAPGATLNITTSRINGGISSLKLGAWQDVAIGADSTGQYLGALSVPQPPTQTHTTCLWDDFVWAACTGGGGTTITLSPGLTSTPGTYNAGAQTVTNGSTLSTQLFYEGHATSYSVLSTDGGKLLTATAAGVTFTVPNPGVAGSTSYNFGLDTAGDTYTLHTVGGTATFYGGCGAGATSFSGVATPVSLVSDGTNWQCFPNGGSGGGGTLTIGTTTIAGGSGLPLSDAGGVLAEKSVTGSGNLVQASAPTISAPTLSGAVQSTGTLSYVQAAAAPCPLIDGSTITVNAACGGVQTVTVAGSRTLAFPTGLMSGKNQIMTFEVTASGTGLTLTLASGYTPSVLMLNPLSGSVTTFSCAMDQASSTAQCAGGAKGFLSAYTIGAGASQIPTCSAATEGISAYVTDAAATPVYNVTQTGGGSTVVPVFCDGSTWKNH